MNSKKITKLKASALFLVLLTVTMLGCIGQEEEEEKPEIKNPNTIITTNYGDAEQLDPAFAYNGGIIQILHVYDTLIFFDKEHVDKFVPILATEVPTMENGLISPDGMTYTFPIREGVKFSNGNPLTPEDVEYSFERMLVEDPDQGPVWMLFQPLLDDYGSRDWDTGEIVYTAEDFDSVVEVEGNNVVFHLAKPYPSFLQVLSLSTGCILDKEWTGEQGSWPGTWDNWQDYNNMEISPLSSKMMGTGPYTLEKVEPGVEVIMNLNENYWGETPQITRIHWKFIDEWSTRKMLFLQGDIDILASIEPSHLAELEGEEGVTIIKDLPTSTVTCMTFNRNISPDSEYIGSGALDGEGIPTDFFTDQNVRLGFTYSFPYDDYIEQAWAGQGKRLTTPIPDNVPHYNPDQEGFEHDLTQAEEYFKQAWGGEVWDKGFKLTYPYPIENEEYRIASEMLADEIEKVNPKFQVSPFGIEELAYWGVADGEYPSPMPLRTGSWWPDTMDCDNFLAGGFMGSYGYYSWNADCSTDQIEELLAQGSGTLNQDVQREAYYALQKHYVDTGFGIPLLQWVDNYVMRDWVQGFYFRPIWYDVNLYYHFTKGYD